MKKLFSLVLLGLVGCQTFYPRTSCYNIAKSYQTNHPGSKIVLTKTMNPNILHAIIKKTDGTYYDPTFNKTIKKNRIWLE